MFENEQDDQKIIAIRPDGSLVYEGDLDASEYSAGGASTIEPEREIVGMRGDYTLVYTDDPDAAFYADSDSESSEIVIEDLIESGQTDDLEELLSSITIDTNEPDELQNAIAIYTEAFGFPPSEYESTKGSASLITVTALDLARAVVVDEIDWNDIDGWRSRNIRAANYFEQIMRGRFLDKDHPVRLALENETPEPDFISEMAEYIRSTSMAKSLEQVEISLDELPDFDSALFAGDSYSSLDRYRSRDVEFNVRDINNLANRWGLPLAISYTANREVGSSRGGHARAILSTPQSDAFGHYFIYIVDPLKNTIEKQIVPNWDPQKDVVDQFEYLHTVLNIEINTVFMYLWARDGGVNLLKDIQDSEIGNMVRMKAEGNLQNLGVSPAGCQLRSFIYLAELMNFNELGKENWAMQGKEQFEKDTHIHYITKTQYQVGVEIVSQKIREVLDK